MHSPLFRIGTGAMHVYITPCVQQAAPNEGGRYVSMLVCTNEYVYIFICIYMRE